MQHNEPRIAYIVTNEDDSSGKYNTTERSILFYTFVLDRMWSRSRSLVVETQSDVNFSSTKKQTNVFHIVFLVSLLWCTCPLRQLNLPNFSRIGRNERKLFWRFIKMKFALLLHLYQTTKLCYAFTVWPVWSEYMNYRVTYIVLYLLKSYHFHVQ